MAVEYGWNGSSWVPLTSTSSGSDTSWGEQLVTWDGTLWHYQGVVISSRPVADYLAGSRVVWDTSQDITFTAPPPLMVAGDLWIPHETVSGSGNFLPLVGGTLTGPLYITGTGSDLTVSDGVTVNGGGLEVNGTTRSKFLAAVEALGGVWLASLPTDPVHAVNKAYTDARTPKITVSTSTPTGAVLNDVWINSSAAAGQGLKVWDGAAWVVVP